MTKPNESQQEIFRPRPQVIGHLKTEVEDQAELIKADLRTVLRLHRERLIPQTVIKLADNISSRLSEILAEQGIAVRIFCSDEISIEQPCSDSRESMPSSRESLLFYAEESREGVLEEHCAYIDEVFQLLLKQLTSDSPKSSASVEARAGLTQLKTPEEFESVDRATDKILKKFPNPRISRPVEFHVGLEAKSEESVIEVTELRRVYHQTEEIPFSGVGVIHSQMYLDNEVVLVILDSAGNQLGTKKLCYDPCEDKNFTERLKKYQSLGEISFDAIERRHHDGTTSYELKEARTMDNDQRQLEIL